ncbi:hypothetical protein IJD34_08380, partial [bacterium]|nr:hypothetical protein [bacterium]
ITPVSQPAFCGRHPKRVLTREEVIRFVEEGKTIQGIAEDCGMSFSWVTEWLKKLDISINELRKNIVTNKIDKMISKPVKAKDVMKELGISQKTFDRRITGRFCEIQKAVKYKELEDLVAQGFSNKEIGEKLNKTPEAIRAMRSRLLMGLSSKQGKENLERVREQYLLGLSAKEISEVLDLHVSNVYKYINKIKLGL